MTGGRRPDPANRRACVHRIPNASFRSSICPRFKPDCCCTAPDSTDVRQQGFAARIFRLKGLRQPAAKCRVRVLYCPAIRSTPSHSVFTAWTFDVHATIWTNHRLRLALFLMTLGRGFFVCPLTSPRRTSAQGQPLRGLHKTINNIGLINHTTKRINAEFDSRFFDFNRHIIPISPGAIQEH